MRFCPFSLHDALPISRDVKVGDRVAIPAGSKALGSVMLVERGGKFKERARLGIRFHTLVLADGTRDRKSTRLNSSHRCISYAVFCLKKKKNSITSPRK